MRAADAQLDLSAEPGASDIGAGDRGVVGVGLDGDETSIGGKTPRKPDRAVAAEGAEDADGDRAEIGRASCRERVSECV